MSQNDENIYENFDFSYPEKTKEQQEAPNPPVSTDNKCQRLKLVLLMLFCALLVAAISFLIVYHFTKLNDKEQELQELKHAYYNVTSNYSALLANHATLQSQYTRDYSALMKKHTALEPQYRTLNHKHAQLRKLTEFYCPVTNPTEEKTCHVCPDSWVHFNSKCYFFSTDKLTWQQSQEQCKEVRGNLVIVENEQEQTFLNNRINTNGCEDKAYWIGLSDQKTEGEFVWVDNGRLDPNNRFWDKSQPDGGKTENCVLILMTSDWKSWHDFSCGTGAKRVCEISAVPFHI